MKVAVTGANGHIGSCLVPELIKLGYQVRVLVHKSHSKFNTQGVEQFTGDVLNEASLQQFLGGVDVVFHLAAIIALDNKNTEAVYAVNVTGTENILQESINAGIKKFIHFSSIHAFNTFPVDQLLDENRALVTSKKGIYEYTKAQSELRVMEAAKQGLNVVILCPTAVIGPNDFHHSFLGQALQEIYSNSLPMLVAGAYNWVDVRDVVAAAIASINKGRKGEKYILSGNYYSLKDLSVLIGSIFNRKTPRMVAPIGLAYAVQPILEAYAWLTKSVPLYTKQSLGILEHSPKNISNQKACLELGFDVQPLEKTLKDTFEWYLLNKMIK